MIRKQQAHIGSNKRPSPYNLDLGGVTVTRKFFVAAMIMMLSIMLLPVASQAKPTIDGAFQWSGIKWDVWAPTGYPEAGGIVYGDRNYLEISTGGYDQYGSYWWGAIHNTKESSQKKDYQSGYAEFVDTGSGGGPWVFFEQFTGGDNNERLRVMMGSMGDSQMVLTRIMQGSGTELVTVPGTAWSTSWDRTSGTLSASLQRNPDGSLVYDFAGHTGTCMIGDGSGNIINMLMDEIDRFSVVSSGAPGSTAVFTQAKVHAHN